MSNGTLSRAALAALVLLTASGCAFGNRTTRLVYPPAGDSAAPPALAADAPVVALQKVVDQRPEPRAVVGWVRNGFGMHTADVITPDDVPAWITGALRRELELAGVKVVDEAPGITAPVLGADVSRVHCNAYWSYSGIVTLRAWIHSGGAYPLNQTYTGKGSGGMNWAGTAEGYGVCATRTLQDAARQVAADAARVLRAQPAAAAAAPRS